MAIVFISPKEKQRVFFTSITALLVSGLLIISFIVFIPALLHRLQGNPVKASYHKPSVMIDLSITDSDAFRNLKPFEAVATEFTYVVKNKSGKQITGNILANTADDAQKLLEDSGFNVISVKEMSAGRPDPFVSY